MPNTPKHPPMTFREAVEITRDRRACYGLDRARAIVDQAVKAHKARCDVCDSVERDDFEDFDYDQAHEALQEFNKLRALERGESEVQP